MQSSSSPLKRPYTSNSATALKSSEQSKAPKVDDDQSPSSLLRRLSDMHQSSSSRQTPKPQRPTGGNRSHRGGQSSHRHPKAAPSMPVHDAPIRDRKFIDATLTSTVPLKPVHWDQPKSSLGNFAAQALDSKSPVYTSSHGLLVNDTGRRVTIWRTKAVLPMDPPIEGYGDGADKKEAETLAALSVLYQLHNQGILDSPKTLSKVSEPTAATTVKLSNGAEINYETARSFMDYYTRLYNFGQPELTLNEVKQKGRNSTWETVMSVNGRRIGIGVGSNKKASQINCYLDVTQYLESCDAELWTTYVQKAKTGEDLGMAPKVWFSMSDGLDDAVRDLCQDIRRSSLYCNRPVPLPQPTAQSQQAEGSAAKSSRYVPPSIITAKSETLLQQRKAYLADPAQAKMRETRGSLPVYTKADEVLAHVDKHDVTICLAATGSGKTTQIPQLILDSYIDRGEGAQCNIVCTQPRRLAAVSVAHRVAKERGQAVGGSVGYQVRFEANLPQDNGSITFCTTGIFLKRMQSALQAESGSGTQMDFDNVTHVVVDEVHERDVDTDLLLVVLKRLMADRKARNKPIKIILMSATIDPTLFQKYFAEDKDKPASVVEVPGRSFPVEKFFMDEYVPKLAQPHSQWVFRDPSVQKYIARQLGPTALAQMGVVSPLRPSENRDDDLELPYPLIALTISHVLRKTTSGHVLVFLPGWDEIVAVQRQIQTPAGDLGLNLNDASKFSLHLLHSTIPLAEQQVIFDPPPEGIRRIILATNIAETSVTIPDVVYVVDAARIKEQRYDPERHMSSLVSAWVGSSNLNQRAGRAGRHRPGEYFGLISRQHAEQLHPYQTVEMKRVDLSNVVMHVKALDFPGMSVEEVLGETIEPPAPERVAAAMKDLRMVGALDDEKSLTALGRVLLQLPVDTHMGRLVLYGSFFRCLDQALTLAAILTNRDPFVCPMHLKQEASRKKNSFSPVEFRSDPLAVLEAFNQWHRMQSQGEYIRANRFCVDNFLAKPTLLMIEKIKGHLLQSLYRAGVIDVSAGGTVSSQSGLSARFPTTVPAELNTNGDSLPLLAALIAAATQPKFAIRTGERTLRTQQDKMVFIHASSVNNNRREPKQEGAPEKALYSYHEKRQNVSVAGSTGTAQTNIVTTTKLDPMTYMLFGAHNLQVSKRGLDCDGWLPITGNLDALDDIERLKYLMEACMLRVFEGITYGRRQRSKRRFVTQRRLDDDQESDDEDDNRDRSLSSGEIKELDLLTRDIVRILDRFNEERMGSHSRIASRAATPMASPSFPTLRLPGQSASGYSTPQYPHHPSAAGAFSSRPGTPSRLSSFSNFSKRF